MDKTVYSLKEAESETGISAETLKKWIQRGRIPGFRSSKGKREVWKLTSDVVARLRNGNLKDDYERLFRLYLDEMRTGVYCGRPLSAKHIRQMETYLSRYWSVLALTPSVSGINAENFKQVMSSFSVDYHEKQDFFATKMHIYKAVMGFLKILVREGYKRPEDRAAAMALRPKKTFKLKKDFLELEEVQQALFLNRKWRKGRRLYDVFLMDILIALYAFAGLRRMEAANLRLDQVHLEKGYLHVYGKWNKERLVPIFPVLREHIQQWLDIRSEHLSRKSIWFVPQYNGERLTESAIGDRFQRLKKEYPQLRIAPHDLRRSCATIVAQHGMPVGMIQLMLGHE